MYRFVVMMLLTVSVKVTICVIGGHYARNGEYPFAISLLHEGRQHCSGVLVNLEFTLSTCHCVGVFEFLNFVPFEPDYFELIGGSVIITSEEKTEGNIQRRRCDLAIIHPNCTDRVWGWGFDYSLLKAETKFFVTKNLQPMTLPFDNPSTVNRIYEGFIRSRHLCHTVGWGKQVVVNAVMNENPSNHLKAAHVELVPWKECLRLLCLPGPKRVCEYSGPEYRTNACALTVNGSDSCDKDDGGPVVCDGFVLALSSKGVDCANPKRPRTIVRLDYGLGFIRELLTRNSGLKDTLLPDDIDLDPF